MSRFAALVVFEANDLESANDPDRGPFDDDRLQYVSGAWEVAESDGSYDLDSVLAQRFDGPLPVRKLVDERVSS